MKIISTYLSVHRLQTKLWDVAFNKPFKGAIERLATARIHNLDAYVKGQLNASVRRVLFLKLMEQAWEEVSANRDMIV